MLQYTIHTQSGILNSIDSQPGHGLWWAIAAIGTELPPTPMDPAPVAPVAAPAGETVTPNPSGRSNQNGVHFGHGRYQYGLPIRLWQSFWRMLCVLFLL
jgi:hypothetical protein